MANDASDVVNVTLLPGWRDASGTHFAGLKITLAPGWKTYWRAPGDGGIPTRVDLSASTNLGAAQVHWPTPQVFRQNGLRSIGYRGEVIVPMALQAGSGAAIGLRGHIDLGVCSEICVPVRLNLEHLLPPSQSANVETLSAALKDQPVPAAQAGVRSALCEVSVSGAEASIEVALDMPPLGGLSEALVIEAGSPHIWVSEPVIRRDGDMLRASARLASPSGAPVTLDLSQIRLTVLTTTHAVDIKGCD